MFERFTERARQVIVLAQGEARLLKHNYIGTEHELLGLDPGGAGTRGAGPRIARGDARRRALARGANRRARRGGRDRRDPVYAACEEGPGAFAARGDLARPRLHRHGAHPARPRAGGRRGGKSHPARPGRRA